MTSRNEPSGLALTRIHPPRPLNEDRLRALLVALASDRRSPNLVLELRAVRGASGATEVAHLLGTSATAVQGIKRMLRDYLPGIAMHAAPDRPALREAAWVELKPPVMPLRTDNAEDLSRALLSALAVSLRQGESLALQIVLGRRRPPRTLSPSHPSPSNGVWQALTRGSQPATAEERRQLKLRAEDAGFDAIVRVGARGSDPERTRRLIVGLHGALFTAKGTGVRMNFVREDPKAINEVAIPRRWPVELACSELVGLIGWPLGNDDLPGVAALHPKPLRASSRVHSGDRVFARSLAPGDDRQLGVSAADALLHTVAYGPTNSGKSTALLHLIEADMVAGRPVAVLDPKEQLIRDVAARVPAHRLDDVVVLDVTADKPIGFNPLDVTGRDPDVVVDGIMSVFGALFADGFGPRTLDIFSGTLRTLARVAAVTGEQATLADIPRTLTDRGFRRQLLTHLPHDEGLAGFWAWYESQSPGAQNAAISAPLNKLRQLLLRPALMRALDQRGAAFRLRDIWRTNAIVLVPLNEALIGAGTAEMLGSLIVADLWQSVQERASETNPTKRPGLVVVDEAPRFLHLPTSLADALALSRSMGVGWALAAQFARQFPKELRTAVDMNARTKIVFGTEYDDAAHFARGNKDLGVDDFMSLPRFAAYANLVAEGRPSGWALVETLPPSKPSIRPERVFAHSRSKWAPHDSKPPPQPAVAPEQPEIASMPQVGKPPPVGRKRRQR